MKTGGTTSIGYPRVKQRVTREEDEAGEKTSKCTERRAAILSGTAEVLPTILLSLHLEGVAKGAAWEELLLQRANAPVMRNLECVLRANATESKWSGT